MSQPDSENAANDPSGELDPADGALDRDSEGVHYISIEDFERRIVPKDSPAPEASAAPAAPAAGRAQPTPARRCPT